MKKSKLYVLDQFTNGHEAALEFIKRGRLLDVEFDIVFCGTHDEILDKLSQGPSYAVVPTHNTIVGDVVSVTDKVFELQNLGYEFISLDKFELSIQHCLIAPYYVESIGEITTVISKPEALSQCGKFLREIGVSHEDQVPCDSTGKAATLVSQMKEGSTVAAIAPRIAAEALDLRILSDDIQDEKVNKTTFHFLQNDSCVHDVKVGIIGIRGQFGQMLKKFFEDLGCTVCGSDVGHSTGLTNSRVVEVSRVVIFAVPVSETPSVIRSVLPYVNSDHLLIDVTSIKVPAVEEMMKSEAQVLGLHPMFRPDVPFDGQTIVACRARLTKPFFKTWVVNMLASTKADIKWSTPEDHDTVMKTVQVLPHLGNLVSALLIADSGESVSKSLEYASPIYRIIFALMGRLIGQSPDLYTSIIMENPQTVEMLKRRISIEQDLLMMLESKDREGFEGLFKKAKDHFGDEVVEDANELFLRLFAVLNTLYDKNSVILEFDSTESRPGLLANITRIFNEFEINLKGVHFADLDQNRQQFVISFYESPESTTIRQALSEITHIDGYLVRVVN